MVCFQTKNTNLDKLRRVLLKENLGIFYDKLVYFTAIRNILWPFGICSLWSFGIFLPVLVFCTKKNLATLFQNLDR
jgi:hypothetical protein